MPPLGDFPSADPSPLCGCKLLLLVGFRVEPVSFPLQNPAVAAPPHQPYCASPLEQSLPYCRHSGQAVPRRCSDYFKWQLLEEQPVQKGHSEPLLSHWERESPKWEVPYLYQEEMRHPHIQDRVPGLKACINKTWDPSNLAPQGPLLLGFLTDQAPKSKFLCSFKVSHIYCFFV